MHILALFLPLALGGAVTGAPHDVHIDNVWIALSDGDGTPSDAEVRAIVDTPVMAWLVVEARVDGERRRFSAAPRVKKGRRTFKTERWPAGLGQLAIGFKKLEADPLPGGVYDNTGTMEHAWHPSERADHPKKWHWCPIGYVESDTGWGNVWSHAVDAKPTTTRNYGGLGTMRFVATVSFRGQEVRSLGQEHRDKAGLRPGIATVRFRRDDTAVGYMTELMNVPYVYGSSSRSGKSGDHQAERGVGVDCADLVVYGWRRAGRKLEYTWSQGLKSHTRRRVNVAGLRGGRYRNEAGEPIAFGRDVQPGDILLWRRHVAVIAERDATGYLTPNSTIIHTVQEVPALIPLRRIGFGFDTPPFEIRRPHWAN